MTHGYAPSAKLVDMFQATYNFKSRLSRRAFRGLGFALAVMISARYGSAQDTPLLSGGGGFFSQTSRGNTVYQTQIQPLIAAPVGPHLLFESRAILDEIFAPNGGDQSGYNHSHFIGINFMQGDIIASRHFTIVAGEYLSPFNTYNERLSPIWINNLQDGPLITGMGNFSIGQNLGGMVRGKAVQRSKYSIDYTYFYSIRSNGFYFPSAHGTGGRASLYLPDQRLEVGFSYDRLLQGTHENFYGTHVWWEPKDTAFRLRSEFSRGQHAQGYWVEADYRSKAFGGLESWVGRIEPVFRIQQTFTRDALAGTDGVPAVNTQRADFGLDYNLPHNTRILTSYSRQFSATGNTNIWETALIYRFLFPAWKGR
jgi:hypothetical protein